MCTLYSACHQNNILQLQVYKLYIDVDVCRLLKMLSDTIRILFGFLRIFVMIYEI